MSSAKEMYRCLSETNYCPTADTCAGANQKSFPTLQRKISFPMKLFELQTNRK